MVRKPGFNLILATPRQPCDCQGSVCQLGTRGAHAGDKARSRLWDASFGSSLSHGLTRPILEHGSTFSGWGTVCARSQCSGDGETARQGETDRTDTGQTCQGVPNRHSDFYFCLQPARHRVLCKKEIKNPDLY